MSAMLLAKNRKALFDYSLVEKYMAGILLAGSEVKAVREGKANFEGSFVRVLDGEVYVVNLYIGPYSKQGRGFDELSAKRNRKLLLKEREIQDIAKEIAQKGKSAVPLALVLENNLVKLEFAVVKGRKEFEKKQVVKDRQIEADLQKETKEIKRIFDNRAK